MEGTRLKPLAFGYAAAVVSAVIMLLLGILGSLGVYSGGVELMQQMHIFFSLSLGGIIAGMIEGAVMGFVIAAGFAWVYNKFVK